MDVKTEKVTQTVLEGGREGTHESFNSFTSGMSWSPCGHFLAFASKTGGRHALTIFPVPKTHKSKQAQSDVPYQSLYAQTKPFQIPFNLDALTSPDWSRDGRFIVFSGTQNGAQNLYIYDFKTDSTRQLTHSRTSKERPVFSPSGNVIVYESDTLSTLYPLSLRRSLVAYHVQEQSSRIVFDFPGADSKMPTFGPAEDQILFVSNESGIDNLYWGHLTRDSTAPVTNILSGLFTPSWSVDGKQVTFSVFEGAGWDIFLMRDPMERHIAEPLTPSYFLQQQKSPSDQYFRSVDFTNLSSHKDSLTLDSLRRRARWHDSPEEPLPPRSPRPNPMDDPFSRSRNLSSDPWQPTFPDEPRTPYADTTKVLLEFTPRDSNDSTSYPTKDYQPVWSLDQANVYAGINPVDGFGGQGYVTFSDLMGDQKIDLMLYSTGGDLRNINAFLGYHFLPYRLDWSTMAFHSSYLTQERVFSEGFYRLGSIWFDRHYGLINSLKYPFSVYSRIGGDLEFSFRSRQEQYLTGSGRVRDNDSIPKKSLHSVQLRSHWVFDNSQWGVVGPINGSRFRADLEYLPPVLHDSLSYGAISVDLRRYYRISKQFTIALRLAAGVSEALHGKANPHAWLVGGDDFTFTSLGNWENFDYSLEDRFFTAWDTPLRGFDYMEFRGSRKWMNNIELRFPFIRHVAFYWPPVHFTNFMGVLFMDYGGAWDSGNAFKQFGMGMGYGLRVNLGIFVLRYSKAWSIDSFTPAEKRHPARVYWSLGAEF